MNWGFVINVIGILLVIITMVAYFMNAANKETIVPAAGISAIILLLVGSLTCFQQSFAMGVGGPMYA